MDALGAQHKCPGCKEYRRSYNGSHGIIAHCFFDHQMAGEEIRLALLRQTPPVTIMGEVPIVDSLWWDKHVTNDP
jgi:hypothetical protein